MDLFSKQYLQELKNELHITKMQQEHYQKHRFYKDKRHDHMMRQYQKKINVLISKINTESKIQSQ